MSVGIRNARRAKSKVRTARPVWSAGLANSGGVRSACCLSREGTVGRRRGYGALEVGIGKRSRVIEGLQMGKHSGVCQGVPNVVLDLLQQLMPLVHRPLPRNQNVERDKASGTCLAGSQCVSLDAVVLPIARKHSLDRLPISR